MAKKLILNTKKVELDNWLDNVKDEQRTDLKECVGAEIEILKGFCYESKKFGRGFTFLFKLQDGRELYSTSFGTAIVRQAEEEIVPALADDSVIVKVAQGTSKAFGSKYLYFESA